MPEKPWTVKAWVRTAPGKSNYKPPSGPMQGDLSELRRCTAPGCERFGILMVQRWDQEARAWRCPACGQLALIS